MRSIFDRFRSRTVQHIDRFVETTLIGPTLTKWDGPTITAPKCELTPGCQRDATTTIEIEEIEPVTGRRYSSYVRACYECEYPK